MPLNNKTTKQPTAKPQSDKAATAKPLATVTSSSTAIESTSTGIVLANLVVAKGFEEERADELKPLASKATAIASEFANFTKRVATFETQLLYKYLGKTYALYEEIKQHRYSETYFDVLRGHLKKNGIKTNKNTSELSLLIRFIFSAKPKTAHLYCRSIEAAQESEIQPDAFIAYVEKEGGLEKLRISQIEQDKAKRYREALKTGSELAWRYLRAMELQPLATAHIPRGQVRVSTPNNFVISVGVAFGVPQNPSNLAEVRMLTCLPADKDTEDFVINTLAKNFAKNLEGAQRMVERMEGRDAKELKDE